MIFFTPKKPVSTERLYLKSELEAAANEAAKRAVELYKQELEKSFGEADFDLASKNVFSIERKPNDRFMTIIGYTDQDGTVQEWYLRVNDENHKKLLERFRKLKNIS
jgi:hypothetical protein